MHPHGLLSSVHGTLFTSCPVLCAGFTRALASYLCVSTCFVLAAFAIWQSIYAVSYALRGLYSHFGTLFGGYPAKRSLGLLVWLAGPLVNPLGPWGLLGAFEGT
jgi:hypothetical protein